MDRKKIGRGLVPREEDDGLIKRNTRVGGGSKVSPYDLTLNTKLDVRLQLFTPRDDGEITWFRPGPAMHPKKLEEVLLPGRRSADPGDYTKWTSSAVPIVSFTGLKDRPNCERLTWVLCHPDQYKASWRTNPYLIFLKKAEQAMKAGAFADGKTWKPSWNKLVPRVGGGPGFGAEIARPSFAWYFQAGVYAGNVYEEDEVVYRDFLHDRDVPLGFGEDDPLCVVRASGRAGEQLMQLLDTLKKNAPENGDFSAGYVYGDPVGTFSAKEGVVKGGLVMGLYRPDRRTEEDPHGTYDGEFRGKKQSYAFTLRKSYVSRGQKYTADMTAAMTAAYQAKVQFFFPSKPGAHDGLIHIGGDEEQAEYTARCFRDEPLLLRLCWAANPEFMTASVRDMLSNKKHFGPGNYAGAREDDEEAEAGAEAPSRSRRRAVEEEDEAPQSRRRRVAEQSDDAAEEVDDFGDAVEPPARRTTRREVATEGGALRTRRQRPSPADDFVDESEDGEAAVEDDFGVDEDEDDFGDDPPPRRQRSKVAPNLVAQKGLFQEEDEFAEEEAPAAALEQPDADEPAESEDDDEAAEAVAEAPAPRRKASTKAAARASAEEDEQVFGDEEPEPAPAPRATKATKAAKAAKLAKAAREPSAELTEPETKMAAAMQAAKVRSIKRGGVPEEPPPRAPARPKRKPATE